MSKPTDKPDGRGETPLVGEGPLLVFESAVGRIEVFEAATEAEARSDPDGAPLVESFKSQVDSWDPTHAALVSAADDSDALMEFYKAQTNIENELLEHERRYQETGEPIASDDAVALARRIKELHANHSFTGRDDYVAYLAGQCLKLKEGRAEGDVYAALARLEAKDPPAGFPRWFTFKLAIPVEIQAGGVDLSFGVQTSAWLGCRLESFLRDRERQGFRPGGRSHRLFDGGHFTLVPDPEHVTKEPAEGAVPVVFAPAEGAIREFISHVQSSADYWDALNKAVKLLAAHGQPLGEALQGWIVNKPERPDGRKVAKSPRNALRNHAIIEAVRALERCGIPRTRNRDRRWLARAHGWNGEVDSDYNPQSGCAIVATAFDMERRAVEEVCENHARRTGVIGPITPVRAHRAVHP